MDAALRGDYASGVKAHCDWDDPRARQELVDRLGADADAVLAALDGRELAGALSEAAELLAAVAGQDLCQDDSGRFMIARRVAKDRVLSTVDPDARHGHKSTARRFDGYKGHTAVDPDSELVTATAVTPANTADAQPAPELINDLLNTTDTTADADTADTTADADTADTAEVVEEFAGRPTVYGDSAYGSGEFQGLLQQSRINSRCRTQLAAAPGGRFTKGPLQSRFAQRHRHLPRRHDRRHQSPRRRLGHRQLRRGLPRVRAARADCTGAAGGRTVRISANESVLAASRARQRDPAWRNDYRAVRPKVERKLAQPRAQKTRRPPRPCARPGQSRRRLQPAGRSRQHRAPRVLGLRSTPQRWALG